MSFTTYTKTQFEDALTAICKEWKPGYPGMRLFRDKKSAARGQEWAYVVFTGNGRTAIKVWSSVGLDGTSREKGADAIRLNLIDFDADGREVPVLPKQAHVKRIKTWQKNLAERFEWLLAHSDELSWCPHCEAAMVERTAGDGRTFMGCAAHCYKNRKEA